MAYIKKEDVISAMHRAINDRTWSMSDKDVMEQMEEYVEALPVANVVEIPCRCEQCKYAEIFTCPITGTETLFCRYGEKPVMVKPAHYCGYGEGAVNHESSKMTE